MPDTLENCANCGQPSLTMHHISLDHNRRFWFLCCLCASDLTVRWDKAKTDA